MTSALQGHSSSALSPSQLPRATRAPGWGPGDLGIQFLAGMPRLPVARKARGLGKQPLTSGSAWLQGLAGVRRRALSHCRAQQTGHTLLLWRSALLPKSLALFPALGMGLTSRTQPVPEPPHRTGAGPAGAPLACAPAPHPPPSPGPCAAGRKLSLQPLPSAPAPQQGPPTPLCEPCLWLLWGDESHVSEATHASATGQGRTLPF